MNEDTKERRSFPRETVCLDGCAKYNQQQVAFKTINLTVEGISFQSEQDVPVGTQIDIDLIGNVDIESNELKAKIIRCEPLENIKPTQYVMAAKFIDANDKFLMDCLALVHSKMRLGRQ